jgi:hypothetical protein
VRHDKGGVMIVQVRGKELDLKQRPMMHSIELTQIAFFNSVALANTWTANFDSSREERGVKMA